MAAPRRLTKHGLREPVRHQPPRPLRPDRAAARRAAEGAGAARGDGLEPICTAGGTMQLRRPPGRAQVRPVGRLRPVEAGQPDVLLRAPAAGHRGGRPAAQPGGASRLREHQPPVRRHGPLLREGVRVDRQPRWSPRARTWARCPRCTRRPCPTCRAAPTSDRAGAASSAAIRRWSPPPARRTTRRRGAGCGRSPRQLTGVHYEFPEAVAPA